MNGGALGGDRSGRCVARTGAAGIRGGPSGLEFVAHPTESQ